MLFPSVVNPRIDGHGDRRRLGSQTNDLRLKNQVENRNNGKDATMTDGNAIVPLTVVNNPGFDLPKTGGYGTWMFTIGGVALLGAAAFIVIRSRKQHKGEQ